MSRARNRPQRTPVGRRNVLTAEQRKGYVRRWVNDEDGRVAMFQEAGYEPVQVPTEVGDPMAGNASQVGAVVRKPVGGGKTAVLMEIPEEFYREDQDAKEAHIKAKEGALLEEVQGEGFYGDGVRIARGRPGVSVE